MVRFTIFIKFFSMYAELKFSIFEPRYLMLWKQCQTLFLGTPKSLQMVISAMKLKDTYSLEGKL